MNRAETTKFLGELLERQYLRGLGKHWAKEVSIDPGSARTHRRIDYMLFQPAGHLTNIFAVPIQDRRQSTES